MYRKLSNKSISNEKRVKDVDWKKEPFTSGNIIRVTPASISFYKVFLLLVAIHTSIFLIPVNPIMSFILLLAILKGVV